MAPLLLAVDFDGTITQRDTLHVVVEAFGAEGVWDALEGRLERGEISIEEAMRRQFAEVRCSPAEARELIRREAPVRAGFARLVAWARRRGHRIAVISAGFRSVIDEVLAEAGVGDLPVFANDIVFSREGARLSFAERGEVCRHCGRRCKRHDLGRIRGAEDRIVYIGDGISDRCVSARADLVFARDSLAAHLDGIGRPYRPWVDFDDIIAALAPAGYEAA